ncbi:hypothetical protein PtB15_1B840 [Puccinia triticina]|nr:hypothetical protein PtB15_1B840 [Puccinia triticina]
MEFWNQIDLSTVLLSPYSNLKLKTSSTSSSASASSSQERFARCRECSKLKPISELKICSKCKIPPTPDQDTNDLNFYYYLQPTSADPYAPVNPLHSPPTSNLLSHADFEKKRAEIESLLKKWCQFHKNVLIFAAIHGLDLIRNPPNSKLILLMISLTLNEKEKTEKFTEITGEEDQETNTQKDLKPQDGAQDPMSSNLFSVAHVGTLDSTNFFKSNPGMSNALKEIEGVREKVKEKGGIGVAVLLVRCGPIVQV